MLEIDGTMGEGGGQILRTSLALSLVQGRPIRIHDVRGGRTRPGLLRQHLTALQAAAVVGSAEVEGGELGARDVTFRPRTAHGGELHFAVGSAGSALLVLQTVLPALLTAREESRLLLEGGTHNPGAPPFEFIERSFVPLIRRMGPRVDLALERQGFYPAGGGRVRVRVTPVRALRPFDLLERGALLSQRATVIVCRLPRHVGERQVAVLERRLGWPRHRLDLRRHRDSPGPGNVVLVELASEQITEVVASFGRRGLRAERVAEQAAAAALAYLASDAPVGEHLADQLMLPLAIAGEATFLATAFSRHASTNLEVLKLFLDLATEVVPEDSGAYRIGLRRR